jgi:uncharacterized protein YraI
MMKRHIALSLLAFGLLALALFLGAHDEATQAQGETLTPTPTLTDPDVVINAATDEATGVATEAIIPKVLIQVVSSVANFRTGPGKVYRVVTWVYRGNKIIVSGISEDGEWYMFRYSQKNTWISADQTITKLLDGDPSVLPVIEAPPVPTAGPASDGAYSSGNPRNCNFDNRMSVEDQNNLLQQVYDSVDANDWHQTGQLARRLYRCSPQITFELLHDIYLPSHPESGGAATNLDMAFAQFYQGWIGQ